MLACNEVESYEVNRALSELTEGNLFIVEIVFVII